MPINVQRLIRGEIKIRKFNDGYLKGSSLKYREYKFTLLNDKNEIKKNNVVNHTLEFTSTQGKVTKTGRDFNEDELPSVYTVKEVDDIVSKRIEESERNIFLLKKEILKNDFLLKRIISVLKEDDDFISKLAIEIAKQNEKG